MRLFYSLARVLLIFLLIPVVSLDVLYVKEYGWPFLHRGVKGLDLVVLGGVAHDEPLYKEVSHGVFEWRYETPKEIYTAFFEQIAILIFLTGVLIWIVRILNRKVRKIDAVALSPGHDSP